MKGDFSKWKFNRKNNFAGVLHQQGRVLLDGDWNAQTRIQSDWQDQAGQDVIGTSIAAVPVSEPDSFKILHAVFSGDKTDLTVFPGRVWADGLSICMAGDPETTLLRAATYLLPPIEDLPADPGVEDRDAVILEVWRAAVNGFQMPDILLEAALGGPDTTERIQTMFRFRLLRLTEGENCHNIKEKLQDDFSHKGKLKVSLKPTTPISGDCPVVEGGGYTGFEHHLYRIEIAKLNSGDPSRFKWSRYNGGLIGRGDYDAAETKFSITANLQAITTSGLTNFYLEVVERATDEDYWKVTYGAEVVLNGADLEVSSEHFNELGTPSGNVFYRLWDGIELIVDFPAVIAPTEPNELRDGIRLAFEAPTASGDNYIPEDYWTFPVRAGEIPNDQILIDNQPPDGIQYHRVPLAVLNWADGLDITFDEQEIEDCRRIFRPLANQKICCSYKVGDGKSSFGDFNSIEEALRHLPKSGGEICLLPGLHETNTRIEGKHYIKIKGCDKHTKVIPREEQREEPIFHIIDSQFIVLENMDMASLGGTPIVLEETKLGALGDVEICHNRILACVNAIFVHQGVRINIHHNLIRMLDKEGADVAIYLLAEDSLIERNQIGVVPAGTFPPPGDEPDDTPSPDDPCADREVIYKNVLYFTAYLEMVWVVAIVYLPENPFKALGGIQIAGGSERVKVMENEIVGGAGNGITLGGVLPAFSRDLPGEEDEEVEESEHFIKHSENSIWASVILEGSSLSGISFLFKREDGLSYRGVSESGTMLFPAEPGTYKVLLLTSGYEIDNIISQNREEFGILHRISLVEKEPEEIDPFDLLAFLYEIQIEENEISAMGLSGIGTPEISLTGGSTSRTNTISRTPDRQSIILALLGNPVEGLTIRENYIFNCWQNQLDETLKEEVNARGFGGISLRLCENVAILENRIENNGTNHIKPTCGIFISFGEEVDVSRNRIVNNGPFLESRIVDIEEGRRGGIVMAVSSFSILNLLLAQRNNLTTGRAAACIHDNIVDQPAGQALTLLAIGPLSILDNKFNSELTDPGSSAGGVQIFNIGGIQNIPTIQNRFMRKEGTDLRFPNGNTLFNSNQTRVGSANKNIYSQLILALDDLGFDGNQSYNHKLETLFANTFLFAVTLRASDNRFRERIAFDKETETLFSLFTLTTLLNNTTNNQGDHCIAALSLTPVGLATPAVIDEGNQFLIPGQFCGKFKKLKGSRLSVMVV